MTCFSCIDSQRLEQIIIPDPPSWKVEYQEWRNKQSLDKQLPEEFEAFQSAAGGQGGAGGWEPASRTTAADTSNDKRSLHRRLDTRLFLFIKLQGGYWHMTR